MVVSRGRAPAGGGRTRFSNLIACHSAVSGVLGVRRAVSDARGPPGGCGLVPGGQIVGDGCEKSWLLALPVGWGELLRLCGWP